MDLPLVWLTDFQGKGVDVMQHLQEWLEMVAAGGELQSGYEETGVEDEELPAMDGDAVLREMVVDV